MSLQLIKDYIAKVVTKFVTADNIINGLQAQIGVLTAERDNAIAECQATKDLNAALQAENAEEAAELEAALKALEPAEVPELSTEEQAGIDANQEDNPQQMEEAVIELAIEDDNVAFDGADTVGTAEETPTEVVEGAVDATAEALAEDDA